MKPNPEPQSVVEAPTWWRSLDEKAETPSARAAAHHEFLAGVTDAPPPGGFSRRDFIGLVGAATTLATATACSRRDRGPVVAYTRRPEEVVPGVANHYATAFEEGGRAYSLLVKTREGRPIHVQGNDEHPVLKGKTSPRAQGDLLRLYDADRLRTPRADGKPIAWAEAESRLLQAVQAARTAGRPVVLVSGASTSPSRAALLAGLAKTLPTFRHLVWEPVGHGPVAAARNAFGEAVRAVPSLERADVILTLGADPLAGDDPAAIAAFAARRRLDDPKGKPNRLYVAEGHMTLAGTKADHRFVVSPSHLAAFGFALAGALADRGLALPAGVSRTDLPALPAGVDAATWKHLADDLHHAGRATAILAGDDMPVEVHHAATLLNTMLGAEGVTYRPAQPIGSASDLETALSDAAVVILWGVNPVHAHPRPQRIKDALGRATARIWIGVSEDETSPFCSLLLNEHHWLEAWGDHLDAHGHLLLQQPAIGALYDSRQGEDILLGLQRGLGQEMPADWHAFLMDRWRKEVHRTSPVSFDRFFEAALHDGLLKEAVPALRPSLKGSALAESARRAGARGPEGFELVLRPDFSIYDGRYGNNGWLQELPDPITKATWMNPLSVSVADAKALGLEDGDLALLQTGGQNMALPVVIQPGQAKGTLVLPLGFGRTVGAQAKGMGTNAFPLMETGSVVLGVKLAKGRGHKDLPLTQTHHRVDGRDIVRSWTMAEFAHHTAQGAHGHELHSLHLKEIEYKGHKWGMAIDMSACVGCSGCVVACTSENNVPVVGPEQVFKGREMHWMRIDRYYTGDDANPGVVHQPMLCQHCDDAPCENVCPVNATNHSPDGLNQMAYNRCVGTRYCANNCPYKVRRFNFLEFTADKQEPESLVFNPEVTVRPRGVMEKCTFCVQRINDGRLRADAEGRPLRDGDIQPACAVSCPAEAIVFGDLNDPQSRVSRLVKGHRSYKVLEELGVRPAVTYLADLKNPAGKEAHHEA